MGQIETFRNPPIVEAILAFEYSYLDDLITSANNFYEVIRKSYPDREELNIPLAATLTRSGQSLGTPKTKPSGFRFTSPDGLQAVQVTRRSLSIHRLQPYIDWEHFAAISQDIWREFVSYFGPDYITEIRLRYLNRLDIPLPFNELSDYVTMCPKIPADIEVGFSGYLLRLTLADASIPARATVTQRAAVAPVDQGTLPVVFDIDVFREGEFELSDKVIWNAIGSLRDYKNRLFFGSITESARELFR